MTNLIIIVAVLTGLCIYIIIKMVERYDSGKARRERIVVYKSMLVALNKTLSHESMGFCWLLNMEAAYTNASWKITDYPELMRYKPAENYKTENGNSTGWWFDPHDHKLRKKILNEIINA